MRRRGGAVGVDGEGGGDDREGAGGDDGHASSHRMNGGVGVSGGSDNASDPNNKSKRTKGGGCCKKFCMLFWVLVAATFAVVVYNTVVNSAPRASKMPSSSSFVGKDSSPSSSGSSSSPSRGHGPGRKLGLGVTEIKAEMLANRDQIAARLAQAVRFPTITNTIDRSAEEEEALSTDANANSNSNTNTLRGAPRAVEWNASATMDLHTFLQETYPTVHATMTRTPINGLSLVYEWKGTDPDLLPGVYLAHQDVVPTPNEAQWQVPPFDGVIKDGFVWGRGTIDDKQAIISLFEAAELLIARGFTPRRTVYFAFGHDEEVNGEYGAKQIADYFQAKGTTFEFLIDEGMAVFDGVVPAYTGPVAMIGVVEKGQLDIELSVEGKAGHSSAPPLSSPVGVLSQAIVRLEHHQMRPHLDPARGLFESLTSGFPVPMRAVLSNLWLFGSIVRDHLAGSPITSPLVRTTTAVTVVRAGVKRNVLPKSATAIVNHRLHPHDSVEDVLAHDRRVINDDRVKIRVLHQTPASKTASTSTDAFNAMSSAVTDIFPDAVSAPGIMVGGTDSKHFGQLSRDMYRFCPTWMSKSDIPRFHGIDERIGVENLALAAVFYAEVIMRLHE